MCVCVCVRECESSVLGMHNHLLFYLHNLIQQ